jgi:hypothetical protein
MPLFSDLGFSDIKPKPKKTNRHHIKPSKQATIIMKLSICFRALTLVVSLGHRGRVHVEEVGDDLGKQQ